MSPQTESLIRYVARSAALMAPAGGVALIALELAGSKPYQIAMLVGGAALIAAGPLFWVLSRAHLTVIGATVALLLAGALVAIGIVRSGSTAGFDLGLGICLGAVALWTLWSHARSGKE